MADWKKPNNKRVGKPHGKAFGVQSQKPNVKYTYTVELGDSAPIEKTLQMFVGKIEAKGESGVLKLVNKKVRFDAVDMKEAAKVMEFDFTLKSASMFENGDWKVIFEEKADEAPEDNEESDEVSDESE